MMKNRNASTFAPAVLIALFAVASGAAGQYCPVASTYFTNNYSRPACTIGTCWATAPFPGSTAISGSQYPSTNYACATTGPASGALENTLYAIRCAWQSDCGQGPARTEHDQHL